LKEQSLLDIKRGVSMNDTIKESKTKKYVVPDDFNYKAARKYFKSCVSCKVEKRDLQWEEPNLKKLKELLESYEFSEKKIENQSKRISNYYKLYIKRRTKIIEQKAGKRMMSKLYKIKDKNNSSDNNSFKIGLVREV